MHGHHLVEKVISQVQVALFANAAGVGGGSVFVAVFASILQWGKSPAILCTAILTMRAQC